MLRLYLYARVRIPSAQLHTRSRVQRAPGLPCALYSPGGTTDDAKLGRKMSREGKAVSIRHCERSDAIHASTRGKMDCFAALAMTLKGRGVLDALSARATTVSCATHRLSNTIFSCNSFIEQRHDQSVITICSFGTQIAALDSTNYFLLILRGLQWR